MRSVDWEGWLVRGLYFIIILWGGWLFWSKGMKEPVEALLSVIVLMLVFILDELKAIRYTLDKR